MFISKLNRYWSIFSLGYSTHLLLNFIDNSISPFGPFLPTIEWGLLCRWQEIPGGGWHSEFWLQPSYSFDHNLWSIFMQNNWGFYLEIEFVT